jgi:CubicO group peptidase (beta-lactamase class C family)
MKTRLILSIIALIFSANLTYGQADLKEIRKYIDDARKAWKVPGMSVAIVKDGEIVFEEGFGLAEVGKKDKVDENTLYAIASNTKAFIAASLATLEESGKLDLDDKVIEHLPYFELYDSYATSEAIIRDLLSHRLGLGTFSGDVIWYKSNFTAEEVVTRARFVPQAYSFRGGYGYSNLMFIAAGEVIHSASGIPWDQYVKNTFFNPLGMTRTQTSTDDLAGMENVATPHKPADGINKPIAWTNWDNMGAAGGIISSVHDMALWMNLHLSKGIWEDDTIFSPAIQNEMWNSHNIQKVSLGSREYMPSRHFRSYGLGWGLYDYHGRMVVNHGGGYDGMYSRVVMVPEENLGVVVLTNSMKGISTPVSNYIIDRYLEVEVRDWSKEGLEGAERGVKYREDRIASRVNARVENTSPTFDLANYTGIYQDKMYGKIIIKDEGGTLQLEFPKAPDLNASLSHWHFDTFKIEWEQEHAWFGFGTLQFIMDNNGNIRGMNFDVPNDDIFFYEMHPVKVK